MARYARITANECVVGQLGPSTILPLRRSPSRYPSNLNAGARLRCLDGVPPGALDTRFWQIGGKVRNSESVVLSWRGEYLARVRQWSMSWWANGPGSGVARSSPGGERTVVRATIELYDEG